MPILQHQLTRGVIRLFEHRSSCAVLPTGSVTRLTNVEAICRHIIRGTLLSTEIIVELVGVVGEVVGCSRSSRCSRRSSRL